MKVVNKVRGRRALATLGAAALGLVGFTGLAFADGDDPDDPPAPAPSVANINPQAEGHIILDKFVTPDPAWDRVANGKPITVPTGAERLGGVTFEIVPVTHIGSGSGATSLDLTTAAGWDATAGLSATDVDTSRHGNTSAFQFGTAKTVVTSDTGPVTSDLLPVGLYLVHEISAGNNPITGPTPPSLVSIPYPDASTSSWLYDVYVYPKNDVSGDETTKTVMDPPQVVLPDGTVVTSNATVDWLIRVPVFAFGDEDYENFEVVDTLDPKLEFVNVVSVKAFSGEIANGTAQGTWVADDDFEVTPGTNSVTISATDDGLGKLNDAEGLITYIEIMIRTNVLGDGILENKVESVVNDWTSTVDPGPTTNWATLEILKHAGQDQTKTLQGAEFKIFKSRDGDGNGVDQVGGTYTTGVDGKITVTLWVGNNADVTETYYVQETKAPAGYVLPTGENAWHTVALTATESATVLVQPVSNTPHDGPELPITGASGQLLMMLGGLALVLAGGGAAVVASRRRHQ